MDGWNDKIENGSPFERLRARQMIDYTGRGVIQDIDEKLALAVMEHIEGAGDNFEVYFLDGFTKKVRI